MTCPHFSRFAPITLSLLLVLPAAAAPIGVWEPVGPQGGFVDALAVDPVDPSRLYALQEGGLVRSVDGGATWAPALVLPDEEILSVAVAPSEPDVVYAGTREGSVYRSLDAGASWAETAPLPGPPAFVVSTLAVVPRHADRVLAGSGVLGTRFVALSTDAGSSWTPTTPGGQVFVQDIAFDPVDEAVVYAASGSVFYRSPDGGATWAETWRPGTPIHEIAAHPAVSGTVFAATLRGVRKSTDGGTTWTRPGGAAGPDRATVVAVDPGAPERIFAGGFSGLWRSADGGTTWTHHPSFLTSSPTRTPTRGIELSPAAPGTLYVLTPAGVLQSLDDGATWRLRTPRGSAAAVADLLALDTGPRSLYAATSAGLFVSEDGGGSWSFVPGAGAVRAWHLAAAGGSPPRLLVATDSALLATPDEGSTWEDVTPQGVGPRLVAVDGVRPDTLYSWSDVLGILRSTDGGRTWTEVAAPANDDYQALVPHPTAADLLLGTASCFFISEDPCGGTWISFDGGVTRQTLRDRGAADLAVRPPQTVFLSDSDGVHRSRDLGGTFELVTGGEEVRAGELLVDPSDPEVVLAAVVPEPSGPDGARRILESRDGGDTWGFLGEPLPEGLRVADLAVDPRRPELLFAATDGGVYRLQRREVVEPPAPPDGPWLESPALAGFRVKVRITAPSGERPAVRQEPACIPETLCVSGAVPGRSEVFVRIVGPKPNGFLWPTLVKFSTSTVEVWIEQLSTGVLRYYRLEGAAPGEDLLPGLFDRAGFRP